MSVHVTIVDSHSQLHSIPSHEHAAVDSHLWMVIRSISSLFCYHKQWCYEHSCTQQAHKWIHFYRIQLEEELLIHKVKLFSKVVLIYTPSSNVLTAPAVPGGQQQCYCPTF